MAKSSVRIFAVLALSLWALPVFSKGRLPILFVHGFGAPTFLYKAVVPIRPTIKRFGYSAYVADLPTAGSLSERARILNVEIEKLIPEGRFHIVAHSMGGLDARLAIQKYRLGERVASLTTIATPHHGTPLADLIMSCFKAPKKSDCQEILKISEPLFSHQYSSLRDLTVENIESNFNPNVKNDARVKYFSLAFSIPKSFFASFLALPRSILEKMGFSENDGLIPASSANWGEVIGHYPSDHFNEVGPLENDGLMNYKAILKIICKNLDRQF